VQQLGEAAPADTTLREDDVLVVANGLYERTDAMDPNGRNNAVEKSKERKRKLKMKKSKGSKSDHGRRSISWW
jgi:hypothetical protein